MSNHPSVNNTSIIKTLLPMLFSTRGRLPRKPFCWRVACVWGITGVLYCLNILLTHAAKDFEGIPTDYLAYILPEMWTLILAVLVVVLLVLLATVFILWWEIVLYVRRLHDLNRSGWLYLVTVPCYFAPLAGNLILTVFLWTLNLGTLLLLCVIKGTRGPNRFGDGSQPDPLQCFT